MSLAEPNEILVNNIKPNNSHWKWQPIFL